MWSTPSDDGGRSITDYVVESGVAAGGDWVTLNDGVSTRALATVTGLSKGVSYKFRVAAITDVGTGAYTTLIAVPAVVPVRFIAVPARALAYVVATLKVVEVSLIV